MKKIGITGQNGFVGFHLSQTINLQSDKFDLVPFDRSFFDKPELMDEFVAKCNVIVHLAALNRHNDPEEIYRINVGLTKKLVDSLNRTDCRPHVLISSSTQEERDNIYGKSKKEARQAIANWAEISGAIFTGMVIPNVFGPFGHPNYNSVVATFCHQVAHDEKPRIEVDGELKLIYVGELVSEILKNISATVNEAELLIDHTSELKVSAVLILLESFRKEYQGGGVIPQINSIFEHNLFNTYRCYMPKEEYFPRHFTKHSDDRGHFVELMRAGIAGQTSFSTTRPGITRGEHFHTRKIERFAVIQGKARIQLRRIGTEEVFDFELDGENPSYVDMPIWYTHNITNIGNEELITVFWINEPYNPEDPDTWFEKVELD
ncbi:MAG: UDP-2-acetamido-2,6-beta-L-arabino-hexul-4-ose reductase [Sediminicola sp.]|jgi:UDP-2-acetamido-2,6-beta-L-arabino-hexul-4-ose reductase